jgi:alanine-synthesizing transaminase
MTFKKAHKLDHVSYDVRGPVLQEAEKMAKKGISVLKLNIGNPAPFGFEAPEEVLKIMADALAGAEGYSDSQGLLSAREAIADYCHFKNITDVTADDVYTGNGVSELILMTMQGLLNYGDEVLVPAPDYPLWTAAVTLAGGKAVHYICDEKADWNPDIADIRSKISIHTKAIILINPNNPTGAHYERDILLQIAQLAREHGLMIFSDEIYDRLVMDAKEHISIAAIAPDLFIVTFNGLSKSDYIAGFRCGWMAFSGDKSKAKDYIEGINMLASMRLCSNVPAQLTIKTTLAQCQKPNPAILPGGRLYEQCDFIYKALNDIPGISAIKPKAGLYIFPKIDIKKFKIKDDEQFVLDFLHQEQVLVVHGKGFNWLYPDHFRIVFLPNLQDLHIAMARLEKFLASYQQV